MAVLSLSRAIKRSASLGRGLLGVIRPLGSSDDKGICHRICVVQDRLERERHFHFTALSTQESIMSLDSNWSDPIHSSQPVRAVSSANKETSLRLHWPAQDSILGVHILKQVQPLDVGLWFVTCIVFKDPKGAFLYLLREKGGVPLSTSWMINLFLNLKL